MASPKKSATRDANPIETHRATKPVTGNRRRPKKIPVTPAWRRYPVPDLDTPGDPAQTAARFPRQTTFPVPPEQTDHARWFADEVQPHGASLKRYLQRSFPSVRDVDDLVQESYLRVWRRQLVRPISQVTGSVTASVKSFLFQVARRLAVDTLRRNRASPIDACALTDFPPSPVTDDRANSRDAACSQQEFELLLDAIDALPVRCREVIVLRKLQGKSLAETAVTLGISQETVQVHTRRGVQKIQDALRRAGVVR